MSQPAVAEQIRKLEQALGADLFVRAGRGVVPTEAGRAFAEHAARSLRAVEDAAGSVGELTALRGGTVALGIFGGPSAWRVDELVDRVPAPPSRRRRCGSSAATRRRSPTASAAASSRPASSCCRSTTTGSTSARSCATRSSTSAPTPSARARPATIERLAATPLVFYDAESADEDPIRRQLAERAQALGVRLQPKVEVELKDIALRLVAAGIGDTYLPSAYTRAPYFPAGLTTASFSPALYDTFAIVTRAGARLSPGVRELLADLEAHMRAVAEGSTGRAERHRVGR